VSPGPAMHLAMTRRARGGAGSSEQRSSWRR
jgi:hypothetical protein